MISLSALIDGFVLALDSLFRIVDLSLLVLFVL